MNNLHMRALFHCGVTATTGIRHLYLCYEPWVHFRRDLLWACALFAWLGLGAACRPLDPPSGMEIVVDGAGHHAGPLPVLFYALTEPEGDDVYPLGDDAYALYGLLDTASPSIAINRRDPPNRVNGANWGMSDADHLRLEAAAVGNLRLNCIARCSTEGYIPIGPPGTPNEPQIELRAVPFAPSDEDVTRIGTPALGRMVTVIDYTRLFVDQRMGIPAPHIDFYAPDDEDIPAADVALPLTPSDIAGGEHAAGQLYQLRDVVFQNDGRTVSGNTGEAQFLLSTASPTTLVGDALAATLGLAPGAGEFDCAGGKNGYVIDAVTMQGLAGRYEIHDASVCWVHAADLEYDVDALIGANFFDQVQLKLDGPASRLGIMRDAPADDGEVAARDAAQQWTETDSLPAPQPSSVISFTLVNESAADICYAFITPVAHQGGYIERLQGVKIAPGSARSLDLDPGFYALYLSDCSDQMLLFKSYIDITSEPTIVLSNRDVAIAKCQVANRFGMNLYEAGQYADALTKFEEAYACFRSLQYALGEGEAIHNIGVVQLRYGAFDQALQAHQRALAIARSAGNRDGESAALNALARIHLELGDSEAALADLEEALAIRRELHDRAGEATIINNIAHLYGENGYFDLAHDAYAEVLAIRREALDHVGAARTLNNIGHLYISEGQYAAALETFAEAREIVQQPATRDRSLEGNIWTGIGLAYAYEGQFVQALEAANLALEIAREVGDPIAEAINLNNVARFLDRSGRPEEAADLFMAALDVLESVRAQTGGEGARAGFIGQYADVYAHAAEFFFNRGDDEQVFRIVERARARSFLDIMGGGQVQVGASAMQEAVQREIDLRAQIEALQAELAAQRTLPTAAQDQAIITRTAAALAQQTDEYDALIDQLRAENPAYAALVSVEPVTLAQVQQLLDETTTLVEYFVLDEATLALIIDNRSLRVVSLDIPHDELRSKVTFLVNQIKTQQTDPILAGELYDRLIAPLEPDFAGSRLIVVPHSVLHYLPFGALWDATHARYLVEDYTISYAPSASVLRYMSENDNVDEGRMLALGNPDGSLSESEAAVRAIAARYDAKLLTGADATETAFHNSARDYDYLHLSAHGRFLALSPLMTSIDLARDDENDGRLEVREVYALDLSAANLVVLSACNTALGEQSAGDELVGLTRAFLYAGAPNVITTLWAIEGQSSGYLMQTFYAQRLDGRSMAAALQAAQIATLARDEWRDPYYWAAFELTGRQ